MRLIRTALVRSAQAASLTGLLTLSHIVLADAPPPQRGQSMTVVMQQHGEPFEILPAVGDPPITRWIYPGFTVYFEHRRTIHSVRHRNAPGAAQPASH
ncbi:MAG: hypothetical protein ACOZAQ_02940 [Pseudomonadota bacterium]